MYRFVSGSGLVSHGTGTCRRTGGTHGRITGRRSGGDSSGEDMLGKKEDERKSVEEKEGKQGRKKEQVMERLNKPVVDE